ncbi:1-phosphofructokinase [Salirhabdus euzebyi]|uniref:Tagatose-6-phosphate kinase n=1 Tax=Salirhabdus euzebyi TaxID=394506 RepID=A0A841Q5C9_9BACI|nr:1-phosphofructokinase [Salirhabdus euzebyi]MBB6453563.1 1-phosphofructokinase [Salirhabdus euzebyi]
MIFTCTLSPAIDYTVYTKEFEAGKLNRADQVHYFPGGKGINVSRILTRLHIENTALGFLGGFTGKFIKDFLKKEQVKQQFIEVESITRMNVKIKSNAETEINGNGPVITTDQQDKLFTQIEQLTSDDILVLAGSIPNTLPNNFYEKIASSCKERGAKLVVDTSQDALKEMIQFQPFLIKPNHHELGELFQTNIETAQDAVTYAKKLVDQGVQNVIVSMGGKGAIFINEKDVFEANIPKGTVKNTVGAGDSVVSGFLASYIQNADYKEAFQYGVAAGTATAFSEDLCTKEDLEAILKNVTILEKNF